LERAFWSSLTSNPPLYGADTPISLFDDNVPWGWNLKKSMGCLLAQHGVPDIVGVTTPMAYFGMWKSFFGWHKEDVDLYSVNYNHTGAAKVRLGAP
jgi:[histone H3]-trimethyl-L-lysine9/36 demethylase